MKTTKATTQVFNPKLKVSKEELDSIFSKFFPNINFKFIEKTVEIAPKGIMLDGFRYEMPFYMDIRVVSEIAHRVIAKDRESKNEK